MPSFSSARGDRVVTETESRIGPGGSASKRRTSVDLPLPEGPDITIKGPKVIITNLSPARRERWRPEESSRLASGHIPPVADAPGLPVTPHSESTRAPARAYA